MKTSFVFLKLALLFIFASEALSDATVPFELIDNRVFVDVKLNGKGPYKFILDTGGSYIVDSELTKELKLVPTEWFQIGGAGKKQVPAYLAKMDSFELGELTISKADFLGIPTREIKEAIGFQSFQGIIGSEFLHDYIAVIDFEAKTLTAIPGKEFQYSGDGIILPITFLHHPSISVVIDGIRAQVWVDTGDRSTLTLFEHFVSKNNLLEKYKPKFETITGWGVGGPIPAKVGEVGSIQLGTSELKTLTVRFPNERVFSDKRVDGSIGTGMLRAYKVFIDYPHQRFILERNSLAPQLYDRSGMFFVRQNGYPTIVDVIENGPAWEAGLRAGDIILKVDGVSFEKLDLPELRSRLSDQRISAVDLKCFRSGKTENVKIFLRKLI